jgi:hypothetical protein
MLGKKYPASDKRVWLSAPTQLALLLGAMCATQHWQTGNVTVLLSCEPHVGKDKIQCKDEDSNFLIDCTQLFLITMFDKSLLKLIVPTVISRKLHPTTLHPFPRLPAELRIRIWEDAILVDIEANHRGRDVTIARHKGNFRVTISRRYPAVFHVSRESRYEVSKISYGEWLPLGGRKHSDQTNKVHVYLDVNKDSILLRGCTELFEVKEKDLTWNGLKVAVWNYGRNLKSPEPMYVVLSY